MEVENAAVKSQVPRPRPFLTTEGVQPGPRCGHTLTAVPDLNKLILFGEQAQAYHAGGAAGYGLWRALLGEGASLCHTRKKPRPVLIDPRLASPLSSSAVYRRSHGPGGIFAEERRWHHQLQPWRSSIR